MKYLSIDIETTGLDPDNNQILSIGAIIEDTNNKLSFHEIPKFHCAIKRTSITGDIYALNMNKDLIEAINNYNCAESIDEKNDIQHYTGISFIEETTAASEFYYFLYENGIVDNVDIFNNRSFIRNGKSYPEINSNTKRIHINVAGKNFSSFDLKFLKKLPRWKQLIRVRSRVIDPAILYTDWENDESLPSLTLCKQRNGNNKHVSHNALEDAWDVIELLRNSY